jgi:selenocysteine-specific elongation factor
MHVIGTAGHVDHGKSSLIERLTGIDPDRFAEEKRRGLTIDLGFAWLELPSGREIGIVDVPGHERFIKNMLAGAGGITICLFVVAANEGWMPQSAEHLCALEVLGVDRGVVALTKVDLVDDEERALALDDVRERLAPSLLSGAPIVACSATTGEGLTELVAALDDVVGQTPPSPDHGRARLWVDRAFTVAGAGTVVTGTLEGGTLRTGEEVELLGAAGVDRKARRARIRTIQSHKKQVTEIAPGNRTALNLVGLEKTAATRGDAVVHPGRLSLTKRIDARVRVVEEAIAGRPYRLTQKGAHLLYSGSAESPVRIKLLSSADELGPGDSAFVQVYLRDSLPLARGDRFVLRDAGRAVTFGGGTVLDPLPERARRNNPQLNALLELLDGADDSAALRAIVEHAGEISAIAAMQRSGAAEITPDIRRLGGLLVSAARYHELSATLQEVLSRHHSANPLEQGMPRERLRAALDLDGPAFDALVDGIDEVVDAGALIRLRSHAVALSPEQQRARDKLVQTIESAGFSPPQQDQLGSDPALIRSLSESGELVRIGDFYLTARQASEARARVRSYIEKDGPVTVAEIRDLLGTTRKYAVPVCEWLDATGATLRRGDTRVLGPRA